MSDPQVVNSSAGAEQEHTSTMISPGARLAAYRQERGWTIEQVASQLNLAPRQILAIESDDFPALPGMAIARGFIRSYAKLLKVDAAPLLANLGGETVLVHESITPPKSLATPFSETRLPSLTEKPALSSRWVLGLLLVLLLGVAFWALREGHGFDELSFPAMYSKNNAESVANTEANAPLESEKVDEQSATFAVPAESNAVTAPAGAPSAASVPAEQGGGASPSVSSAEQKDGLLLKIRQDSWLEIKRVSNGSMVVARIAKAGETEFLDVTEPVSVVIGNAAGVEASLRGATIDLMSSTASSGNVARLNLK